MHMSAVFYYRDTAAGMHLFFDYSSTRNITFSRPSLSSVPRKNRGQHIQLDPLDNINVNSRHKQSKKEKCPRF